MERRRTRTGTTARLLVPALVAAASFLALPAAAAVPAGCAPARLTTAGVAPGKAAASLVALEPQALSVTTSGVTLSARSSLRLAAPGRRIVVRGRVSVARGAPSPFRVLVVARPLDPREMARFSVHAIAYVRMDGSYAATIRPRRTSDVRVIALPLRTGDHLAEATLGTVSVPGDACPGA
jgi:hypothetical protein